MFCHGTYELTLDVEIAVKPLKAVESHMRLVWLQICFPFAHVVCLQHWASYSLQLMVQESHCQQSFECPWWLGVSSENEMKMDVWGPMTHSDQGSGES